MAVPRSAAPGTPGKNGCVTATTGRSTSVAVPSWRIERSARRGAAARSGRPATASGSAAEASASPSRRPFRKRPTANGSAAAAPPTITAVRARLSGIPSRSTSRGAARSITTEVPMTMAVIRTASTRSVRANWRARRPTVRCVGAARSRSSQLPYSASTVCTEAGSRSSTRAATRADAPTNAGVVSVVTAETATATGKRKSRVAPRDVPRLARMNENSPICARLMPVWIARRVPLPVRNAPKATAADFPSMTRRMKTAIGSQCCATRAGSISMPTDTKKIAAKRSRTGRTRCSTSCAAPDSATSDPAMKAPSATE